MFQLCPENGLGRGVLALGTHLVGAPLRRGRRFRDGPEGGERAVVHARRDLCARKPLPFFFRFILLRLD